MSNTASNTQTPQRFSGEWETKLVSEFGNVVTGATPSTKVNAFWNGPYPWITPTDITSERDMTVSERMITQEGLNAIRTLPPNTVLITCIASIGKNAILRATGSCNQQINAVIPNSAHSTEFLYYLFEYNANYLLANAGITATNIVSKATFSNLVFEVPPLPEQRAIAEALSDVDGLLSSLEALIAKKQAIKRAVMQQLLTGRTRLLGFSGAWEAKRVSEFGDVVTGETPNIRNKAFWDGPYPWITPTDITSDRDMTVSERMLTQEGLNSIRRTLPPNTVLVTCIASIGKNAILKTTGSCNQQINAVVPNAAHNVEFLYYLFEYNSSYLLANAGVTATPIISKSIFSEFVFQVPSLEEQRSIASILSDIDAEIAALEQRRDKTRAIKQGMMQQLLTGRVRLFKSKNVNKT